MQTQGAFNVLFRAGLRKDFRDSYQMYEPEYPQFLRTGKMDGPEEQAVVMTGLKRLLEIGDGESVTFEDPKMSPKVVGVDKEFALGFIITKKSVEDDKYRKANQAAKWLAEACRMTYEYRSGALLDDAFDGNTFKGFDNLALCHRTHTLLNSTTTVANRPAANAEVGFSYAGVQSLLDLAANAKNENGDPIKISPDTAIYNPNDISTALQIFGPQMEPFTADRNENAVSKRLMNVKQVVKRHVTNSTSYHLLDSKWNDAHFLMRRPVEFDDDFDFFTRAAMYMASTRFLIWFVDWKGWYGAKPS